MGYGNTLNWFLISEISLNFIKSPNSLGSYLSLKSLIVILVKKSAFFIDYLIERNYEL